MNRLIFTFIILCNVFVVYASSVPPLWNRPLEYPLIYSPETMDYVEGEVVAIETDSCDITTLSKDAASIKTSIDSLQRKYEEYESSISCKSISDAKTYEDSLVCKKQKRELLLFKLKLVRHQKHLERIEDSICAPTRYVVSPRFISLGEKKRVKSVFFHKQTSPGRFESSYFIRDKSQKMLGKKVYALVVYSQEYKVNLEKSNVSSTDDAFIFNTGWKSANNLVRFSKTYKSNHKYKQYYLFLKDLYEARSFNRKFKLVEKSHLLFPFTGKVGEKRYRKMIKLNFPNATEEQKRQLLALKNLN